VLTLVGKKIKNIETKNNNGMDIALKKISYKQEAVLKLNQEL